MIPTSTTNVTQLRIGTIVVGLLLVIGVALAWNSGRGPKSPSNTPQEPIANLTLVAEARTPQGEVTLLRDGNEVAIADGTDLVEGDVIRTEEGTVSVEFFAGSRVALDTQTEIEITVADIDAANPRSQNISVALHGGRIWNRVLKLLEVNSNFEVKSSTVTATVRGTAFAFTSHPGTAGSPERVDLFEGQLGIRVAGSSPMEGNLGSGFSFLQGAGNVGMPFAEHVSPTPDETRNDTFIRAQLRADDAFLDRVESIRKQLGDDIRLYETVGAEAGPFTLDQAGAIHSGYQSLEVRVIDANTFRAIAHLNDEAGEREVDVTEEATWELSDASIGAITNGALEIKRRNSPYVIVARWNDGTHEHSGSISVDAGGVILKAERETTIQVSPPVIRF